MLLSLSFQIYVCRALFSLFSFSCAWAPIHPLLGKPNLENNRRPCLTRLFLNNGFMILLKKFPWIILTPVGSSGWQKSGLLR